MQKVIEKSKLIQEQEGYIFQASRSLEWEKKFLEGALKDSREATGISYKTSENTIRNYHERRIESAKADLLEANQELERLKEMDIKSSLCPICEKNNMVSAVDFIANKCDHCRFYPLEVEN